MSAEVLTRSEVIRCLVLTWKIIPVTGVTLITMTLTSVTVVFRILTCVSEDMRVIYQSMTDSVISEFVRVKMFWETLVCHFASRSADLHREKFFFLLQISESS